MAIKDVIGRFKTLKQGEIEEEYDEDGRLISTTISEVAEVAEVAEETEVAEVAEVAEETEETEEEYDEDGRLISTTISEEIEEIEMIEAEETEETAGAVETEEVTARTVETEEEINGLEIEFALVNPECRFVQETNEWELNDNENGLFFIRNVDDSILGKNIELKNSDGNVVWSSEIRQLPKNKMVLVNSQAQDLYISKKVIRSEDIPSGDYTYFASIREIDSCDKMAILNIYDMRNNLQNEASSMSEFNIKDIVKEEDVYTDDASSDSDDDYLEPSSIVYIPVNKRSTKIRKWKRKEKFILSNKEFKEENTDIEEQPVTEKQIVCPEDIKSIAIQAVINHLPVNIDCRKNDVATKLLNSIVIEKIGNYYIVILNGFMNMPIYILNGEEQYFDFEGTASEFLAKIQLIVCRMYSMKTNEFNNLTKLFILDELGNSDEEFEGIENIKILSRNSVLNEIVHTDGKVIVDLLYNACNLVFNDEENNTVKIVCEGLGLKKGESVLESIKSLSQKLGEDRIILTGLFIDSNLYNQVKDAETDNMYTVDMLSKYITL